MPWVLNAQAKGLMTTAVMAVSPTGERLILESVHRRSKRGIARANLSGKADSGAAHGCTVLAPEEVAV